MTMIRMFQLFFLAGALALSSWVVADPPNYCTGNTLGDRADCSTGSNSGTPESDNPLDPEVCLGESIPASQVDEIPVVQGLPLNNAKYETELTICCAKYGCVVQHDDSVLGYSCVAGTVSTGNITFYQGTVDPASCTKKPLVTNPPGPPLP